MITDRLVFNQGTSLAISITKFHSKFCKTLSANFNKWNAAIYKSVLAIITLFSCNVIQANIL